MHQNIRGLKMKVNRLQHYLNDTNPSILVLTEHGLKRTELEATKISGYSLVTDFSREDHKLGGVAVYSRDSLVDSVTAIDISNSCQELILEAAMVCLKANKKDIYVLGIYRPPCENVRPALNLLSDILELQEGHKKTLLLIGDINIDRLTEDTKNTLLEEELTTQNIWRYPLDATRITHNTSTSIDFICSNVPHTEITGQVLQTGLSDHTAQLCQLKTYTENAFQKYVMSRQLTTTNLNKLKAHLHLQDWKCVHSTPDLDTAYNTFNNVLQIALDSTCPVRKINVSTKKKQLKYYDPEAKILKENFLKALHKYELTNKNEDKEEMINKKRIYDLKLRNLKVASTTNFIEQADNKSKALWQVINKERKGKCNEKPHIALEVEGKIVNNAREVAEHLNLYFSQIAEKTISQNRVIETDPATLLNGGTTICLTSLTLTPTTYEEVQAVINSLQPKSSSGTDEFSSKMVKHCSQELIPALVSLVNKSFENGQFPSALKVSKVYPKHKKGPTSQVQNYRPISLVSTFSKILEKIALARLMTHLTEQNLLTENQHGFRKTKSTSSAINSLIEYVLDQIDNEQFISAIFLDYSKAFDCLGHDLICTKLERLGIRNLALRWFKNYLTGRSQIVELQHTTHGITTNLKSSTSELTRGVPQGSVLGPILFILLTNDFPKKIENDNAIAMMYADDTTILVKNETAEGLYQNSKSILNKAVLYSKLNDLAINPSKTTSINFSKKRDKIPQLQDVTIETHTKFLGVILDNKLTWAEHIDQVCKKISTGIYVVRRMSCIGRLSVAKTAYYALVESHLRYGLTAWGGSSAHNINRILVLQKKAIRTLANLEPTQSCRPAFTSLEILTVVALYILETILYVDKLNLPRHKDLHDYNTRHGSKFALPAHRTSMWEKKPSYTGCKMRNNLPDHMKNLTGNKLHQELKKWLIQRPFYSLTEFYNSEL